MYYRQRSRTHSLTDYIMPFLIIICVGVIIVLLFNLFMAVFFKDTSGDAYLHIESGSAEVRMWGTEEFFNLTADALVMKGDEIRTSADAKIVIEFFDGTLVRLGGGTYVVVEDINEDDSDPAINLLLVDGKVWVNKLYKDTEATFVQVKSTNTVAKSLLGNIFEVENEMDEVVRVLNGDEVVVDVLTEDQTKVVETESVGVGQEIVFNDKVLDKYWQFQSPSVLSALSDEFKATSWYVWNIAEDKAPTQFSKAGIVDGGGEFVEVQPEVFQPIEGEKTDLESTKLEGGDSTVVESEVETVVEPEVVEEPVEVEVLGTLAAPTISSVAGVTETNADGFYVVSADLATLAGSVSGAAKVVVNGYTLQKFKAGDTSWAYHANANGLMQPGENTYEVYALSSTGVKSESIFVKVLYVPPVVEEPVAEEPVVEEPVVEEAAVEGAGDAAVVE